MTDNSAQLTFRVTLQTQSLHTVCGCARIWFDQFSFFLFLPFLFLKAFRLKPGHDTNSQETLSSRGEKHRDRVRHSSLTDVKRVKGKRKSSLTGPSAVHYVDRQQSAHRLLTGEISLSAPMHPHVAVMMMHRRRRREAKYRTRQQLRCVEALARKFPDE